MTPQAGGGSRPEGMMVGGVPTLLITGPVGVGKTSVGGEVSALLERAAIPHAFVDMDALGWCFPAPPGDPFRNALTLRNLAAVWDNYRAAGARRLVLARVIESRDELAGYEVAIPGATITIVRLRAAPESLTARLRGRELGAGLDWHLARAAELAAQMERDRLEDYVVDTDGRLVAEIAREVLARSGWPGIAAP